MAFVQKYFFVQNREKCHLHALSVLTRTIKKMTVFYLEMINDDFDCARGGFPPVAGHRLVACVEISLSRLSPLPARLPYQHSFASTEGGVGSRGRYHMQVERRVYRWKSKTPSKRPSSGMYLVC